jgi:hypothetical protein
MDRNGGKSSEQSGAVSETRKNRGAGAEREIGERERSDERAK